MGNVTFKVDAQVGKAINGFLKIVDSQRKMERGFSRSMRKGRNFDRTLRSMKHSAKNLVGGLVGAAGIRMALRGVAESIKYARNNTIKFEDEMTGLLSLGSNIDMIDQIKSKVLDMSGAFGIARKNISDTLFNLQSGSAGLSKTIQKDVLKNTLELVKVTGTELPTAMNALLKSYRIFGSETQTVNTIQNKLFKTAELGYLTFEDLAKLLPDLESAAKTFGFSLNEVGGAVITATQKLGRTRKTLTALRNVFLGMTAAQKKGVKMTGDFVQNVEQLSKMDPEFLLKAFGKRTVAAIGALTDNTESLRQNIQAVASVQGDIAGEKLTKRLEDQAYAFSELAKSIAQVKKNLTLTKGYAKEFGKTDTEYNLRELGVKSMMPQWVQKIPGLITAQTMFAHLYGDPSTLEEGKRIMSGQFQRTGQTQKLHAMHKTLGTYEEKITGTRDLLRPEGYKYQDPDPEARAQEAAVLAHLKSIERNTRKSHSYEHPEAK